MKEEKEIIQAKLKNTIALSKANSKYFLEKPLETSSLNIKQKDQVLKFLDELLEESVSKA